MNMASFIGNKVQVEADDGVYIGTLKAVDQNYGRLSLERVTAKASGKKMSGTIHFFKSDIINVTLLDDKKKKVVSEDNSSGAKLLGKKETPAHLKRLRNLDYEKLTLAGRSRLSSGDEENEKSKLKNCSSGEENNCQNCSDSDSGTCNHTSRKAQQAICDTISDDQVKVTIIENMDEHFTRAIEMLKGHTIVGLAMEGINLGRSGQLCFVQFAVKGHIILFDLVSLGRNAMKGGIADILKSENIQKVVHDCRLLSDMLYNQYGTNLVNVFDTQVAMIMVYRSEHNGDVPKFAYGLQNTLFEQLGLSPDEVYVERMREQYLESDMSIWKKRPANREVLQAAARDVAYLRRLRLALLERMLSDFTDGVDIYLGTVRDASDDQAKVAASHNNSTPEEFTSLQASARVSRARHRPGDYDQRGFRVNCPNTDDPMIRFSHDGVWHKNDGTTVRSRPPGQKAPVSRSRGRAKSRPTTESDHKEIVYLDQGTTVSPGKNNGQKHPSQTSKETDVSGRMDEQPEKVDVDVDLLDKSVKDMGLDQPVVKPLRSPDQTRRKPNIDPGRTREPFFVVAGAESVVGQFKLKDRASYTGSSAFSEDDSEWELVSESEYIGNQFDQIPNCRSKTGTETKHPPLPVKSPIKPNVHKTAGSNVELIPDKQRGRSIPETSDRTAIPPPCAAVQTGVRATDSCGDLSAVSSPPVLPRGRGAALIASLAGSPPGRQYAPSQSQAKSSEEQFMDALDDHTSQAFHCLPMSQPLESNPRAVLTKGMGRASALQRHARPS